MTGFRFAVSIMPRDGMLDPQGRAVEAAMLQLDAGSVRDVRVGRLVELSVEAATEREARSLVERLAVDLLANPLVEKWHIEAIERAAEPVA